jgi:hypothetical protein
LLVVEVLDRHARTPPITPELKARSAGIATQAVTTP